MGTSTYSETASGGQQPVALSRAQFSVAAAAASHDECIPWPFYRDDKDYGHTRHEGVRRTAHWVSCYLRNGPPPFAGAQAAHLCHNNWCCNGGHLQWQTCQENIAASVAVGKHIRGERVHTAKLTEKDVVELRAAYAAGGVTQAQLAQRYGVLAGPVSRIINRKVWRHVA